MQYHAVKLRFTTPVHLGRGSDELDKTELVYHSDSLKSALYAVGLPFFEEWANADYFFNGFKISSCFPYAGNEYFFPRPMINKRMKFISTKEELQAKKAKKVEYITKSVFEKFINSKNEEVEINEALITPDGAFICENKSTFIRKGVKSIEEQFSFYKTEVQQRVAVPLEGDQEDSRPFYLDRIYFEKDCGLYFLATFNDDKIQSQVFTALAMLSEQGIGTDRTVGNGLFSFNVETDVDSNFNLNSNSTSQSQLLLGLYLPEKSEFEKVDLENSSWSMIKRGGYMAGSENENQKHLRRKSIYMFGEGSVLKSTDKLNGNFIDLKPAWNEPMHPVWRCGMPLIINI